MRSARVGFVSLAIGLALGMAEDARAWGPDGHRIVCRIAYRLLDEAHRAEVVRLTALYRDPAGGGFPYFTDGCNFADTARAKARDGVAGWERFAPFANWHFVNVARDADRVTQDDCHDDCVLTGIARHAELLTSAFSEPERAEALFFLGHWVGDIHQPLHVSFADDRGGNRITVASGGPYESGDLHGVWDSGIVRQAIGSDGWRIYADRLADEITPAAKAAWSGRTPLDWAEESYERTTWRKTRYCAWRSTASGLACGRISGERTLTDAYQVEFQDDVEQRLEQAGFRLAELLREHLTLP